MKGTSVNLSNTKLIERKGKIQGKLCKNSLLSRHFAIVVSGQLAVLVG